MIRVLGVDARLANMERHAGVGTYCRELLRALPNHLDGWRLRLYLDAPARAGFPLTEADAAMRVLPPCRFWTQRALRAELLRDPPAVFLSPVLQLPRGCPCPSVVTVHDLAFLHFPDQFTWRRRWLARMEFAHAVRSGARLLAVSESARREILRRYAVDPSRITVTSEAPAPQFRPAQDAGELDAVRTKLKLPGRYVLFVGRIQPRKNLARLMEAFSRVLARHPALPHHLIIAGGAGWLDSPIHAAAQASPVRDRIRFLGYVDEAALPPLIAQADVLALVSLWEGFGLPVIEAMACGTAVLASNCSSIPEVAGDAASLVEPLDTHAISAALERLLVDDTFRQTLAARGPAQAARFTWDASAGRVMEAVRAAAGVEP